MLVNTNVKLQMTVEIALPALSSLCSVSDYYLFNGDEVKICIKVLECSSCSPFSSLCKVYSARFLSCEVFLSLFSSLF